MREKVVEGDTIGMPRREDSSVGTVEGLLARGVATGDQIINTLCNQKVSLPLYEILFSIVWALDPYP